MNFWKLSMGKDFKTFLEVLDLVRQGLVLVHKDTKPKATKKVSQGAEFIQAAVGDYFYLCHGKKIVILLGQFTGPANLFSDRGEGWAERPFAWIRTSKLAKPYKRKIKWWTPNHNSTFSKIPEDELGLFESLILVPYFEINLADFGIKAGKLTT